MRFQDSGSKFGSVMVIRRRDGSVSGEYQLATAGSVLDLLLAVPGSSGEASEELKILWDRSEGVP